jgi:hypothetical protein
MELRDPTGQREETACGYAAIWIDPLIRIGANLDRIKEGGCGGQAATTLSSSLID